MTSFIVWALSLLASPTTQPPPEIPQGMSWCTRCDSHQTYDVLPGSPDYDVPSWAFCCYCGSLLDVDLPEEDAA